MTDQIYEFLLFAFFIALPAWVAYKIGHNAGYSASCDIDRKIAKVNLELYGDCPTCHMELNPVSVKRVYPTFPHRRTV